MSPPGTKARIEWLERELSLLASRGCASQLAGTALRRGERNYGSVVYRRARSSCVCFYGRFKFRIRGRRDGYWWLVRGCTPGITNVTDLLGSVGAVDGDVLTRDST